MQPIKVTTSKHATFQATVAPNDTIPIQIEKTRTIIEGGTYDYEELNNKPSINGVTLIGNKTDADLGIKELSNLEIEALLNAQF